MKRVILTLASLAAFATAGSAAAATATGNLAVTATVDKACSVGGGTIAFGTVVPATGVTTPVTGTMNVTCTFNTTYDVGLGDGSHFSATRRMQNPSGHFLTYELYRNAGATERFGNTDNTDRTTGVVGLGNAANTVSVYGLIPSGQSATASAGAYADTVLITVTF